MNKKIKNLTIALTVLFTAAAQLAAQTPAPTQTTHKVQATQEPKPQTKQQQAVQPAQHGTHQPQRTPRSAAAKTTVAKSTATAKAPEKETEKKIDKSAGVLVVTRPIDTQWKDTVNRAAADLRSQTGPIRVVYTGGDVKELQSAVDTLTGLGAQSIIAVPLFLSDYDVDLQYITQALHASTDTYRESTIKDNNIVSKLKINVAPAIGSDPHYIAKFVEHLKPYKTEGRKNYLIVTAPNYPNIEGEDTYDQRYGDMQKLAKVLGQVAKYDASFAYLLPIKGPGEPDAEFITMNKIGEVKNADTLDSKMQELIPSGTIFITVFGLSGETTDIDIKKNIKTSFYIYVPPPALNADDIKELILNRIKI